MLQAPVQPLNYSLRERRKSNESRVVSVEAAAAAAATGASVQQQKAAASMADVYDDDAEGGAAGGKVRSKSRRELPSGAVATLKAWLLSPEHFSHPYPTPQDQAMLMQKTGIDKKQLKNWFTNARRRIWKPMLKKQIESGQLTATGTGVPGAVPGLMLSAIPGGPAAAASSAMENPHSVQAIRVHYQQAVQQQQEQQIPAAQEPSQQQAVPLDSFGNPMYPSAGATTDQQQPQQQPQAQSGQFYSSQPTAEAGGQMLASVSSLGTLPRLSSGAQLSKTDSHAVLMELFARDQDLVRQATESARLKAESKQQATPAAPAPAGQPQQQQQPQQTAQPVQVSSQHPMKAPTVTASSSIQNVPTMNSWPHFSSITSLNNLGTIPGVKSITSLSGADLASKGNVNKMGNLAQVKSMESMGKNDSYAFLEVFFGDKSTSAANLSSFGSSNQLKGKQVGEEQDNEIGLSLEDESPSQHQQQQQQQQQPAKKDFPAPTPVSAAPQPAPLISMAQDAAVESGTLKRAYDDALAARGLMSVSRSSEKLTDLVLPAKIQRTLSQEFINKDKEQQQLQKQQQQQQQQQQQVVGHQFSYTSAASATTTAAPAPQPVNSAPVSHQYPGQQPAEPDFSATKTPALLSDSSETGGHVQVPSTTKCALCMQTNVDTQLRPCGHMFHERCLKPSLKTPRGPPKCPVDDIPMHSAVLAVPTDENAATSAAPTQQHQQQQQPSWSYPTTSQSLSTSTAENK